MKKLILLLTIVLILLPTVNAFGPWSHVAMLQEVCDESYSWPNKELCCVKEKDSCFFGMLETDATVFYYVTNFKKYSGTHSWGTVEKCFEYAQDDKEKAFCVGMAVHNAQDSISHNFYVPDNTKNYKIFAEAVTHPFLELGVDDTFRKEYPNLEYDTTYYLSDENIQKFCVGQDSIIQRASGGVLSASGWECSALAGVVSKGGFYQEVFLIGPILNYGYKGFIKFANFLPSPTWQPYEDQAKVVTRQTFQDILPRQYDPTGHEALRLSEFGWWVLRAILIIGLVVLIVKTVWGLRKK